MAFARQLAHIFVDMDGDQISLEPGVRYRVVETIFVADQVAYSGYTGAQSVESGRLFHTLVPRATIREEPEVE
jgi:hypothetical protein